jgi:hypothetical protein
VRTPLAAIYFGGFGNNWVDHGEVKRYRDVISFPGLEINEAAGQTFGKAMLEWNLPPVRFAHFGTPGCLRELAALGRLRHRSRHRSGRSGDPQEDRERRRPGGLALQRALPPGHDVLPGLGGCLRGGRGAAPGGMISLKILE